MSKNSLLTLKLIAAVLLILFCVSCSQNFAVIKGNRDSSVQSEEKRATSATAEQNIREALLLYRQGDLEASRIVFTNVLKNDPLSWQSHYYLGRILTQTDNDIEAEQQLMLALDYAPKDSKVRSTVYLGLAILYEGTGMVGKAELNFRTALNLNPQSRQATEGLDRLAKLALR